MKEKGRQTTSTSSRRGNDPTASVQCSEENSREVVDAVRNERRRIARQLHDGLQQEVTLLVLLVDALIASKPQSIDDVAQQKLLAQARRLSEAMRNVVEELLPEDAENIDELLGSSAQTKSK